MKGTLAVVLAAVLVLVACGKEESQPAAPAESSGGGLLNQAKQMGNAAMEQGTAAMQSASEQAVAQVEKQYESLKASATQFKDEELNTLLGDLKDSLATAKAKAQEIGSASQEKAKQLQVEVTQLIQDKIKPLYDQAMAKMTQLKASMAAPAVPAAPAAPQAPAAPEAPAAPAAPQQ